MFTMSTFAQNENDAVVRGKITAAFPDLEDLDDLIDDLREESLGWGEVIMVIYILANVEDTTAKDILALRADGKGWGQIAKELGLDPGALGRAVAAVMSGGKVQGGGASAASGKPEGAGKPDHAPGPPEGKGKP